MTPKRKRFLRDNGDSVAGLARMACRFLKRWRCFSRDNGDSARLIPKGV
jgi:hypothetical protein